MPDGLRRFLPNDSSLSPYTYGDPFETNQSRFVRPIGVAIQGGGALGAFPWGALVPLLHNRSIKIIAGAGVSSAALTILCMMEGLIKVALYMLR